MQSQKKGIHHRARTNRLLLQKQFMQPTISQILKVQGVSPEKFNKMFRSKSPKRVANNEKKSRMINSKSAQEQPDPITGHIRRRSFLYTKFVKNS